MPRKKKEENLKTGVTVPAVLCANDDDLIVSGLAQLSKSTKETAVNMDHSQLKFVLNNYKDIQNYRMASANQIRTLQESNPNDALTWIYDSTANIEIQVKKILERFVKSDPVGQWMTDTIGIGPVIAATYLANIDINKAKSYNHVWSYCGLNDGNNPWLGTAKANELVADIYATFKAEDKEINSRLLEYLAAKGIDKKDMDKATEILSKFFEKREGWGGVGMILQIEEGEFKGTKKVQAAISALVHFAKEEFVKSDPDIADDWIIRNFIFDKAVTERIKNEVSVRTGRRIEVINNGLINMVWVNKKEDRPVICNAKNDLVGYLSKPPYNLDMKQCVYLTGESFVKVSGNPKSLYGRLYRERKAYEIRNNENLVYKDQAEQILSQKNYGKSTESYKYYIQGKLPPLQIHCRSRRFAVKIFISHLWEMMFWCHYGYKCTQEIYPIAYLNHKDYIGPEVPFERYAPINVK